MNWQIVTQKTIRTTSGKKTVENWSYRGEKCEFSISGNFIVHYPQPLGLQKRSNLLVKKIQNVTKPDVT